MHIIQRYLGHTSSEDMTMLTMMLRKEIEKYLGIKVVNINGEVIESLHREIDNDADLQWMKKVLTETLSNGCVTINLAKGTLV